MNPENELYFKSKLDFISLKYVLTPLGVSEIYLIKREKYEDIKKKSKLIIKKDILNICLYLPKDLKNTELIDLIKYLGKELNISSYLSENENRLEKLFFIYGINILRNNLNVITKKEVENQQKYCEENNFKLLNKGEFCCFSYSKEETDENIIINSPIKLLNNDIILLKDKVYLEDIKEKLDKLRKDEVLNYKLIQELELIAVNMIFIEVKKYSYFMSKESKPHMLNRILENKEINCLSYSIIAHSLLTELKIKHYGLEIHKHSALCIVLNGENYFFDPK